MCFLDSLMTLSFRFDYASSNQVRRNFFFSPTLSTLTRLNHSPNFSTWNNIQSGVSFFPDLFPLKIILLADVSCSKNFIKQDKILEII